MKKHVIALAAGVALLSAAQSSFAASVPAGSVNYQVVLEENCIVNAFGGGTIDLGTQPSYAGNRTVPAIVSLTITCSSMAYGICVSGGTHYNGTTRRLKDAGTNYLNYDLQNADTPNASVGDKGCNTFAGIGADTAAWADPIGGAVSVGPPRTAGIAGTGSSQSFAMNAIVTIPANSLPGTYTDNGVQLTIVW